MGDKTAAGPAATKAMHTRGVFFDAAGTLIHLPQPVGEHYRTVAARFGVELAAVDLDRAFRAAWREAPPRPPTADGQARPDDDKGWWRELVRGVFARTLRTGLPGAAGFRFEDYFEEVYAHFAAPGVWAAYPDVPAGLRALAGRGLVLAVVSNFDRRLHPVLADLGLAPFFARVIISSEVGADKPDPRIFEHALAAVGLRAPEVLHVGDDPVRDWGAAALGLPVFELARPGHSLADVVAWIDAHRAGPGETGG